MKLTQSVSARLEAENELKLAQSMAKDKSAARYLPLLQLVAQMCDMIANGENIYMIIGATSKKDSYSLSVKLNNEATTVYASTLEDLSTQAGTLL